MTTAPRDALDLIVDTLDDSPADLGCGDIVIADIRSWQEQERKFLVGKINDRIKYSETKILLDAAQMEITRLQEQHAVTSRKLQYLEHALRVAEDAAS